jgi:hypothetical protein
MGKLIAASVIGLFATVGPSAHAAEIKALITTALKTSIEDLAPQFERATGHASRRLRALERACETDHRRRRRRFCYCWRRRIDQLIKQGKVIDGSDAKFARSMIGAAVAKGARGPTSRRPTHSNARFSPPSRSPIPTRRSAVQAACIQPRRSRKWHCRGA